MRKGIPRPRDMPWGALRNGAGPPRAEHTSSRRQPPWPLTTQNTELTGTCGLERSRKTQAWYKLKKRSQKGEAGQGHAGEACWSQGWGPSVGRVGVPGPLRPPDPKQQGQPRWVPPPTLSTEPQSTFARGLTLRKTTQRGACRKEA